MTEVLSHHTGERDNTSGVKRMNVLEEITNHFKSIGPNQTQTQDQVADAIDTKLAPNILDHYLGVLCTEYEPGGNNNDTPAVLCSRYNQKDKQNVYWLNV